MGDEPPPLPPKMRSSTGVRYTEQDMAKALEEENKEYERIRRELGRSHSQRQAPLRENGLHDAPRSQTPTERHSRPVEVKPRPRPGNKPAQPTPKPRTISLTQNAPKAPAKSRSASQSMYSHSLIAAESVSVSRASPTSTIAESGNDQQDLISFNSPEKPKNDILEYLHTINANQKSVVPVSTSQGTYRVHSISRQTYSSHHSTSVGPTASLATYQGAMTPMFSGSQCPAITQNGTSYPNYSPTSTGTSYRPTLPTVQPTTSNLILNYPSSLGQLVPVMPPLPQRCPVVDLHNVGNMFSQLTMPKGATGSPVGTPTTAGVTLPDPAISASSAGRIVSASNSDDLIDLGKGGSFTDSVDALETKTSVLDVFDPIMLKAKEELRRKNNSASNSVSSKEHHPDPSCVPISDEAQELLRYKCSKKLNDDEMSYYEQVDPFEYMHPGASSTRSDPVYDIYYGLVSPGAVGGETFDIPPPLPPRSSVKEPEVELRKSVRSPRAEKKFMEKKRSGVVLDGKSSTRQIRLLKIPALSADDEARAFWDCIKKRRGEYTWDDHIGNPGLLHSACLEGTVDPGLSVKLSVYYKEREPLAFTCNLDSSVEHVVMHTVCTLELPGESADYMLKVRGVDDYLSGETVLGEYEYVHNCIKYDQDVAFTLMHADSVRHSYQRTQEDDIAVLDVRVEDLMSAGSGEVVHHESLIIVVETFETELTRLQNSGFLLVDGMPLQDLPSPMRSRRLRQVVKQMCAILGNLETTEVSESINNLVSTCRIIQQSQPRGIGELQKVSRLFVKGVLSMNNGATVCLNIRYLIKLIVQLMLSVNDFCTLLSFFF